MKKSGETGDGRRMIRGRGVEFQISYQCNAKGRKQFEDSVFVLYFFLFL